MVQCGERLDPFLPRPFSICAAEPASGDASLSLLVHAVGPGSRWLAARRPGDELAVTGPLGKALEIERNLRHLLCIAEGWRIASLLFLVHAALAGDVRITLALVPSPGPSYPPARLPPEVEIVPIQRDGASALGEHLRWADKIVVAGDESLLRAVWAEMKRQVVRRPAQAFASVYLPCGTGICGACTLAGRRHSRLVCRDGLWLELSELF